MESASDFIGVFYLASWKSMLAITNHYDISIGIFNVKPGGIPRPFNFPHDFNTFIFYVFICFLNMRCVYIKDRVRTTTMTEGWSNAWSSSVSDVVPVTGTLKTGEVTLLRSASIPNRSPYHLAAAFKSVTWTNTGVHLIFNRQVFHPLTS